MLDTAAAPGDFAPPALPQGSTLKKMGEYDVISDATADREKSVGKQKDLLATARDAVAPDARIASFFSRPLCRSSRYRDTMNKA